MSPVAVGSDRWGSGVVSKSRLATYCSSLPSLIGRGMLFRTEVFDGREADFGLAGTGALCVLLGLAYRYARLHLPS
jgi:hypothetical protein